MAEQKCTPELPITNLGVSKKRQKLHMFSDGDLEKELESYILTRQEMLEGGFPLKSQLEPEFAEVLDTGVWIQRPILNPEAKEFVPSQRAPSTPPHCDQEESVIMRKCKRCPCRFPMDKKTGDYIVREQCAHHPQKFIRRSWQCCGSSNFNQEGCVRGPSHVWTGFEVGCNKMTGFVETKPLGRFTYNGYGVFALDCEMAFTKRGMDIIKISVVLLNGEVVYDEYVKPVDEIVDYGSEIHGITKEQVLNARKSLDDVHNDLLQFIHAESILVGHGVYYDLRVMRLIHNRVIDTCYVFPHSEGLPRRLSLRRLAKCLLQVDIHAPGEVHDSVEDARTAMDVLLTKLEIEFGLRD